MLGSLDEKIFFKAYYSMQICYNELLNNKTVDIRTDAGKARLYDELSDLAENMLKGEFLGTKYNNTQGMETVEKIRDIFFNSVVCKDYPNYEDSLDFKQLISKLKSAQKIPNNLAVWGKKIRNIFKLPAASSNLHLHFHLNSLNSKSSFEKFTELLLAQVRIQEKMIEKNHQADEKKKSTKESDADDNEKALTEEEKKERAKKEAEEEAEKAKAFMKLVAVTIVAGVSGFVGAWYMLAQLVESLERFFYNEDVKKAALIFLTVTLTALVSNLVIGSLVAESITAFAVTAGMANPAAWAIFCIGFLGMAVSGASTHLVNTFVLNAPAKNSSNESELDKALSLLDIKRFILTELEKEHLKKIGLDAIKVQCAIAALVEHMNLKEGKVPARLTPSVSSLFAFRDQDLIEDLNKIRYLKKGDIFKDSPSVEVGSNLRFNLRLTVQDPVLAPSSDEIAAVVSNQESVKCP